MSFIYVAGPCVIESEEITFSIASRLKEMTADFDVDFYFKASFDKANRTSMDSFRGPGMTEGIRILAAIKKEFDIKVLTDVHTVEQVEVAARVLDVIQIPAFLSRQTDLLVEAGRSGKIVNIKKAQVMAPEDIRYAIDKVESTGNRKVWVTERGTAFGYNNLVVDFRALTIMSKFRYPVIFDATHSVQIPSLGGKSSGNREFIFPLARAATAYGSGGLFTEVHPDPKAALSDGANSLQLDDVTELLRQVTGIVGLQNS